MRYIIIAQRAAKLPEVKIRGSKKNLPGHPQTPFNPFYFYNESGLEVQGANKL